MLALLIILPITVGVPWWLERQESLAAGSMPPPAPVVDTGAALMAGSTWEFRGVAVGAVGDAAPPPEGVELVDAVFDITPEDEEAADRLAWRCAIHAEDGAGRSWDTATGYDNRDALDGEELADTSFGSCTDAEDFGPLTPGESARAVVSFLVPEDAVSSLRFVVTTHTNYPEELGEDIAFDAPEGDGLEWDPDSGVDAPHPVAVAFPTDSGV